MIVKNVFWITFAQSAKIISQLANVVVLSRILPPSDYGLMGMAMVVTNLGLLLKDMGTTAAIIQVKDINASKIEAVFWFNVVVGISLFLIVSLTAPLVAHFFSQPALVKILVMSSLIFPISSFTAVHQALLEKESNFQIVARIEFISIVVAIIGAVILALNGFGVYSLVYQALITVSLTSIQLLVVSKWRPQFKFHFDELKQLFAFSSNMTGFQMITYAFRSFDVVLIGKFFGPATLGFYSLASKIMLLPIQNVSWIAARSLYPVMSKAQEDDIYLKSLFLKTLGFIALLTAPIMVGIFVLRNEFIDLVLGPKWHPVAEMLGYLAPVGFFMSILGILTTVLMAKGKGGFLLATSSLAAVIHFALFYAGINMAGVNGLILAYLLATLLASVLPLSLVFKLLGIKFSEWARIVAKVVSLALMMGFSIHYFDWWVAPWINNKVVLIAANCLMGVVVYLVLIMLFDREKLTYLKKILKKK